MLTKNVHYSERPNRIMIIANGSRAVVEFPIGISKVEKDDGYEYVADKVYSAVTQNTDNLYERVDSNYDMWLEKAMEPETKVPELADVVEALNALTEIVIGG